MFMSYEGLPDLMSNHEVDSLLFRRYPHICFVQTSVIRTRAHTLLVVIFHLIDVQLVAFDLPCCMTKSGTLI